MNLIDLLTMSGAAPAPMSTGPQAAPPQQPMAGGNDPMQQLFQQLLQASSQPAPVFEPPPPGPSDLFAQIAAGLGGALTSRAAALGGGQPVDFLGQLRARREGRRMEGQDRLDRQTEAQRRGSREAALLGIEDLRGREAEGRANTREDERDRKRAEKDAAELADRQAFEAEQVAKQMAFEEKMQGIRARQQQDSQRQESQGIDPKREEARQRKIQDDFREFLMIEAENPSSTDPAALKESYRRKMVLAGMSGPYIDEMLALVDEIIVPQIPTAGMPEGRRGKQSSRGTSRPVGPVGPMNRQQGGDVNDRRDPSAPRTKPRNRGDSAGL